MRSILMTAILCVFATSYAQDAARFETIGSVPGGQLEAIYEAPNGDIYVTNTRAKELLVWPANGAALRTMDVDIHPIGILGTGTGEFVLTAIRSMPGNMPGGPTMPRDASFAQRFGGVGGVVVLMSPSGEVLRQGPTGPGTFPNGLDWASPTMVLVADSMGGTIFQFDTQTGTVAPWLKHDLFAPSGPEGYVRFGINGLKVHDGWVYVGNSTRGAIYRVRIGDDGQPQGMVEKFAETPNVDDFAVADDGTIYVSNRMQMVKVSPEGVVAPTFPGVPPGPNSQVAADGNSVFVVTQGDEQAGRDPALLRVWFQ